MVGEALVLAALVILVIFSFLNIGLFSLATYRDTVKRLNDTAGGLFDSVSLPGPLM